MKIVLTIIGIIAFLILFTPLEEILSLWILKGVVPK